MLVTERPGFGASSPDAALSWERHADDLAAILDAASVEKLPVIGGSGGAPYVLAFAARHPERVAAATIVSGAAPIQPAELPSLIELNAAAYLLARAGDRGGMKDLLEPQRLTRLDDPLAAVRMSMATAPTEDQTIMNDPAWQDMLTRGTREALRQGVDAWVDESMLMFAGWDVLDPTLVRSTVTWWHGADDRNCPVTAPMRLVDKIPSSQLRVWREAGHLTAYREEGTILDELLSRAG
jgi:pimeloyl-ACP methyl ester carboxylesterase